MFKDKIANSEFETIRNSGYSKEVAYEALKRNRQYQIIRNTYEIIKSSSEIENIFISNDEDGNTYIEGIVASTTPNKEGIGFSEELLSEWANDININGLSGRADEHEEFDTLATYETDIQKMALKLKTSMQNVADIVLAKVEDGKLWVRAKIRKGFEKLVNTFKAFSVEAVTDRRKHIYHTDRRIATSGKIMGFTFTNKPNVVDTLVY